MIKSPSSLTVADQSFTSRCQFFPYHPHHACPNGTNRSPSHLAERAMPCLPGLSQHHPSRFNRAMPGFSVPSHACPIGPHLNKTRPAIPIDTEPAAPRRCAPGIALICRSAPRPIEPDTTAPAVINHASTERIQSCHAQQCHTSHYPACRTFPERTPSLQSLTTGPRLPCRRSFGLAKPRLSLPRFCYLPRQAMPSLSTSGPRLACRARPRQACPA